MENNKDIDYTELDYSIFRRPLQELVSANASADEAKAADLRLKIAKLDQQIAALDKQKKPLMDQLQAIEAK